MKLVINRTYGGFSLPQEFMEEYNIENPYNSYYYENRSDSSLIEWIEENQNNCNDLEVIEIPDSTTDYEIEEYDGLESVIYIVNGKIHHK